MIMTYLIAYAATVIVFLAIDVVWLGVIMRDTFQKGIGHLMADNPNFMIAAVFYIFYVGGVVFFAVAPALETGEWQTAALYGALLGLIAYGTYDMTNLATLKNYPAKIAFMDTAWGGFLTGLSATAGYFAVQLFK